ncbi:hypothetical protein ACSCCG_01480 [Streptomyces caniscabiei]|uniref:hypothetical protein n=1 Tax=Streptomyces TaxID=1883 RepID=UPI0005EDFAE7|nr:MULTISPECIES: hypothetical protein [Streptomyces]
MANVDGRVEGEVAGERGAVDEFAARLRIDTPTLARVRHVRLTPGAPDTGICDACLRELRDPATAARSRTVRFSSPTDAAPSRGQVRDRATAEL